MLPLDAPAIVEPVVDDEDDTAQVVLPFPDRSAIARSAQ
jgi:hypothetical protein